MSMINRSCVRGATEWCCSLATTAARRPVSAGDRLSAASKSCRGRSANNGSGKVSRRQCRFETLEDRSCPATLIWVGDLDRNWATSRASGTNWSDDRLPADGDTLVFSGATPGTLVNNLPAGQSFSLRFTASGYTLTGNSLRLDNPGIDLFDGVGGNSLQLPLSTAASDIEVVNGTLAVGAVVSGAGALTKLGEGSLRLDAANTFSGGVVLRTGSLDLRNNAALGTGVLTIAGGTLIAGGGSRSLANPVRVEGDLTLGGSNNLTLNAGGVGGIRFTATTHALHIANGTRTLFLDGAISVEGDVNNSGTLLRKSGPGRLAVNRASSFAGGIDLVGGTLSVGDSQALGTSALVIYSGALQADNAARTLTNSLVLQGDLTVTGTQRLTLAGAISFPESTRTWTIDSTAPAVVTGALRGGNLIKAGLGTLQVVGASHDFRPYVAAGGLEFLGGNTNATEPIPLRVDPRAIAPLSENEFQELKQFLASPQGKQISLRDDAGQGRYLVSGYSAVRLSLRDDAHSQDITDLLLSFPSVDRILAGGDETNDVLRGTSYTELILGLGGNDTLNGGPGSDWIFGGEGDDWLLGGDNADYLAGGAGNDQLAGGLHDDILDGGAGNDVMQGEDGYDQFWVRGDEAEYDQFQGGPNTDTIVNQAAMPVRLNWFEASIASVEGWSGAKQPIVGNANANRLDFLVAPGYSMSLVDVPFIDGAAGDDTIVGTHGLDDLRGGPGNDRLAGLGGVDRIWGGEGDDWLDGGEGIDWLSGDQGADTITTGGGRDVVVFADDLGSIDTLVDFALYSDRIDLSAYAIAYSGVSFQRASSPNSMLVRLNNSKQIRLLNWTRVVAASQFGF